jgi:hypothetical protein
VRELQTEPEVRVARGIEPEPRDGGGRTQQLGRQAREDLDDDVVREREKVEGTGSELMLKGCHLKWKGCDLMLKGSDLMLKGCDLMVGGEVTGFERGQG